MHTRCNSCPRVTTTICPSNTTRHRIGFLEYGVNDFRNIRRHVTMCCIAFYQKRVRCMYGTFKMLCAYPRFFNFFNMVADIVDNVYNTVCFVSIKLRFESRDSSVSVTAYEMTSPVQVFSKTLDLFGMLYSIPCTVQVVFSIFS